MLLQQEGVLMPSADMHPSLAMMPYRRCVCRSSTTSQTTRRGTTARLSFQRCVGALVLWAPWILRPSQTYFRELTSPVAPIHPARG